MPEGLRSSHGPVCSPRSLPQFHSSWPPASHSTDHTVEWCCCLWSSSQPSLASHSPDQTIGWWCSLGSGSQPSLASGVWLLAMCGISQH